MYRFQYVSVCVCIRVHASTLTLKFRAHSYVRNFMHLYMCLHACLLGPAIDKVNYVLLTQTVALTYANAPAISQRVNANRVIRAATRIYLKFLSVMRRLLQFNERIEKDFDTWPYIFFCY